jgi:hypothetical protein
MKPSILSIAVFHLLAVCLFAASPDEEARFTAAVKKAFASQDGQAVIDLSYLDAFSAEKKQRTIEFIQDLVTRIKQPVDGVSLVRPPPTVDRVKLSLPITKRLEVFKQEGSKRIATIFAVGEKDGKLYILF